MTIRDEKHLIERGIAQDAQSSPVFKDMASRGLVEFLREQIIDAEWKIARAKTEIAAYEHAIARIEGRAVDGETHDSKEG